MPTKENALAKAYESLMKKIDEAAAAAREIKRLSDDAGDWTEELDELRENVARDMLCVIMGKQWESLLKERKAADKRLPKDLNLLFGYNGNRSLAPNQIFLEASSVHLWKGIPFTPGVDDIEAVIRAACDEIGESRPA